MEKEIGKIEKNDTTDIVLRVDDFGGRKGLTIREFITGDRYTGFTKSGVRILSRDFSKFKEMINSITEEDMKEVEAESEEESPEPEPGQETLPIESKDEEKEQEDKEELPDY